MNQQELSHALRKEAIKNGHAVQTLASGYSMFPFLRKGDLLTVEPVSMDKIKRGDVVVFESDEKWIAHRVIKIRNGAGGLEFLLRGDTCIEFDPVVDKENYIGHISSCERNKPSISFNLISKKINTKIHLFGGVFLCRFLNYSIRALNVIKSIGNDENSTKLKN
jgi:signal peptidase I